MAEKKAAKKPAATTVTAEPANPSDQVTLEGRLISAVETMSARLSNLEAVTRIPAYPLPPTDRGCGDAHVSCCCFDLYISRARIVEDQSGLIPVPGIDEPGDADLGPLDPLNKNMEMIFHVVADGMSGVYPSLTTAVAMSQTQGWVSINKKITQLSVSGTRQVSVMAEAREIETSVLGGRAEHGSSDIAYMNLACGCPALPVVFPIALDGGGNAGGKVEVEVTAREGCCDGC